MVTATAGATYANPLRDVAHLTAERVDQGVDYGGTGPVYALGNGIVENVSGPGWPGGVFIQYRLTDGPLAGMHVYVAEDIHPTVSVGQQVNSSTIIGQMFGGSSGIETGWANANIALQQALGRAQWTEGGPSTAAGADFNALLTHLGAPSGIIHGPISGTFPGGYEAGALSGTDVMTTAATGSGCPEGNLIDITMPSVIPNLVFTRCNGRAWLGAAMILLGGGLMVVAVALMASQSRLGKAVASNL